MKDTKVIAAFPACGKTYCFDRNEDYIILDSDSSKFSWMIEEVEDPCYAFIDNGTITPVIHKNKVRNPDFPKNYIEHIKENIGKVDYIFVSTHEDVRNALTEAGIDFILVFPEQSLRDEWVGRCFNRGSGEKFCQLISDKWDDWILQMEFDVVTNNRKHYRLKHGEYLSNVLERL